MRRGYETRSLPLPKRQTAGSGVFGRDEKNAGARLHAAAIFTRLGGGEEKEKAAFL